MSYSARQQHCLEAMGIVPWIARDSEQTIPLGSTAEHPAVQAPEPSHVATVTDAVPLSDSATDIASDLQELGTWLPRQQLADFGYKGAMHTVLGHPEAPLLVIAQRHEKTMGELPLSGESAQLFELMMRSIELSRSDFRQCALTTESLPVGRNCIEAQTVSTVCSAHTRAIVFLTADEQNYVSPEGNHCRLADSQLPVWRIDHPENLLRDNQRKRQAWQSLKALQLCLAASVT